MCVNFPLYPNTSLRSASLLLVLVNFLIGDLMLRPLKRLRRVRCLWKFAHFEHLTHSQFGQQPPPVVCDHAIHSLHMRQQEFVWKDQITEVKHRHWMYIPHTWTISLCVNTSRHSRPNRYMNQAGPVSCFVPTKAIFDAIFTNETNVMIRHGLAMSSISGFPTIHLAQCCCHELFGLQIKTNKQTN